jgi:hypothetical protein
MEEVFVRQERSRFEISCFRTANGWPGVFTYL